MMPKSQKSFDHPLSVVGEENTLVSDSTMGGEDFSYYQKEVPGCYVWLGSRNEEKRNRTWPTPPSIYGR